MNYGLHALYLAIAALSGLCILALKLRASPPNSEGALRFVPSTLVAWLGLGVVILSLCLMVSADFLLSAFYAIFVFIALFIVSLGFRYSLLRPNISYGGIAQKASKTRGGGLAGVAKSFLRGVNIVVISPILGGLTGAVFHALVPDKEVNLIVYTAFVASISFAVFITYFASVQNSLRATLFAVAYAVVGLILIFLSGKVSLA